MPDCQKSWRSEAQKPRYRSDVYFQGLYHGMSILGHVDITHTQHMRAAIHYVQSRTSGGSAWGGGGEGGFKRLS